MSEHPQARRMKILQAIIEDFVASREPVGSKALVDRHDLNVSSATVRNDMSALEEEGFIVAPHTSAGRIPTDKGYRTFVDRIHDVRPLSQAEKSAIHSLLNSTDDPQEIMAKSVQLLAKLTQQVAVVQYPHIDGATVRHIELVPLAEHRVLVVLILSSGRVDQRHIITEESFAPEDLEIVRTLFLQQLSGVSPLSVSAGLAGALAEVPTELSVLGHEVAEALRILFEEGRQDRIMLAGTANLARSPGDFPYSIGPILNALEEQVVLLKLLTEMEQDMRGLSVRIGSENTGSLAETSVVAASYGPGAASKLGVVGPTRMDYPGTMGAVRAIARYLSRVISE